MIEINLSALHKGEKKVSVKGHQTKTGYVKPYIRVVKTATQADDEIMALETYKEAASRTNDWIRANPDRNKDVGETNEYTVSDYDVINTALRDDFTDVELSGMMIGDQIKSISSFLTDAPKFNGMVYRGMGFNLDKQSSADQYYKFIDDIMKSDTIVLKPFTSTSQDKDRASEFIGKSDGKRFGEPGGILLKIKSKTGVALDGVAEFPIEREVLFNKGIEFKVIKYALDPNTKTYNVELEEI